MAIWKSLGAQDSETDTETETDANTDTDSSDSEFEEGEIHSPVFEQEIVNLTSPSVINITSSDSEVQDVSFSVMESDVPKSENDADQASDKSPVVPIVPERTAFERKKYYGGWSGPFGGWDR